MKLHKSIQKEHIYGILIFIIAFFLTSDLFLRHGQPATFDGPTHITTMAQFYTGLSQGQFPVVWADGFANYGMPIPLIAQQTTNYVGSIINFITQNIILSHNLVYLLGAFLSSLFFYIFLRIYFKPEIAFLGTFLFNFSSYRIINIYIRGAQPEFFAPVFIPLSLVSIHLINKNHIRSGFALLIFSTAMIIFTHPFMFIVSLFLTIPYAGYIYYKKKNRIKLSLLTLLSIGLGICLTGGYIIPLFGEIKYFYYSRTPNHLVPDQFLTLKNFFDYNWYYYYRNDIFIRGNFIQVGIVETLTIIAGIITSIIALSKRSFTKNSLLLFASILSLIFIFMMIPYSSFLYQYISFLNGIQFPWRFLGAFIFIPPIILCSLVVKSKHQHIFIVSIILLIAFIRFPQIYGKNFTYHPQSTYFFTIDNLHGTILNTVWTGNTSEYPVKRIKYEIIEGKGNVKELVMRNGVREYQVIAESNIKMADYTFYFPGWKLYIDGSENPIQYQDPKYRGVITYDVPTGKHNITLRHEPTKIRTFGYIVSILAIIFTVLFITKFVNIPNKRYNK